MYPVQSIVGTSASSIAAGIEDAVTYGRAGPGTRLPAIRTVADHLDVAAGTVARAYRLLRDRGIVETQGRNGTVIRQASVLAPRNHAMPVPDGAVDLSAGDPRMQPDATQALAAAARAPTGYPGTARPTVLPELLEVFADRARADGLAPDHGMLTIGSMYGLELAVDAHLRPGDALAVEDPGWSDHLDLFTSMGLELVPVPVDDHGMHPDALATVVDRVRAVLLTPRAQNPTGAAMDARRRDQIAGIVAGRRILVLEDDHAGDIAGVDLAAVATAPVTDHWVIVRSMSKAWGPDLRLAVAFGDAATIRRMRGRLRLSPGWVSRWLQAAALHLLRSPAALAQVEDAREVLATRRGALVAALSDHGITAHARSGVNTWVPVPDEATVVAGLLARGWVVAPGSRFRQRSGPGIRITVTAGIDGRAAAFAADLAAVVHGSAEVGA